MSSVDLTQFHKTFFEESLEGLDAMEAALLALDSGSTDGELVHTIFRAAHSIKGAARGIGAFALADAVADAEKIQPQDRAKAQAALATMKSRAGLVHMFIDSYLR